MWTTALFRATSATAAAASRSALPQHLGGLAVAASAWSAAAAPCATASAAASAGIAAGAVPVAAGSAAAAAATAFKPASSIAQAVRHFSTNDGPTVMVADDDEQSHAQLQAKLGELRDRVIAEAAQRRQDWAKLFGDDHVVGVTQWMAEYGDTPRPEFIPTVLQILSEDEDKTATVEMAAQQCIATILSKAIEEMPEDAANVVADFYARTMLADNIRLDLSVAILNLINNEQADQCVERIAEHVRNDAGEDSPIFQSIQQLRQVPRDPVEQWPRPTSDLETLREVWMSPMNYECIASLVRFKTDLIAVVQEQQPHPIDPDINSPETAFAAFVGLSNGVMLESLYGCFMATHDPKYLICLAEMGMDFMKFDRQLDVRHILQRNMPLPDELQGSDNDSITAQGAVAAMQSLFRIASSPAGYKGLCEALASLATPMLKREGAFGLSVDQTNATAMVTSLTLQLVVAATQASSKMPDAGAAGGADATA